MAPYIATRQESHQELSALQMIRALSFSDQETNEKTSGGRDGMRWHEAHAGMDLEEEGTASEALEASRCFSKASQRTSINDLLREGSSKDFLKVDMAPYIATRQESHQEFSALQMIRTLSFSDKENHEKTSGGRDVLRWHEAHAGMGLEEQQDVPRLLRILSDEQPRMAKRIDSDPTLGTVDEGCCSDKIFSKDQAPKMACRMKSFINEDSNDQSSPNQPPKMEKGVKSIPGLSSHDKDKDEGSERHCSSADQSPKMALRMASLPAFTV
jgi:hypothetical protein